MKSPPSGAAPSPWRAGLALAVAGALLVVTGLVVDLAPRVDDDFFFSRGDPALRSEERILERFGSASQIVILASSRDVASEAHRRGVERVSAAVEGVAGVTSVRSLARGPEDLADARASPLWRRLLLAGDGSTSFVIVEGREPRARELVAGLEEVVARHVGPDLDLRLAGVPYTVEVMRRQLVRDFSVFSTAAIFVFGAAILLVFRSGWILLGTLVTCSGAVAATLLALHLVGAGIGLLTANLTTIVYVLAQSHVVFMASNWQALAADGGAGRELARKARRRTLRASVGSAATTLLGFASLLFVPARPLQELGAGGSLGALIAFAAVFLALPPFLERARSRDAGERGSGLARSTPRRAAAICGLSLALGLCVPLLETDPSLLAYFDDDGEVHAALSALDRSGGSSPLRLVVRRDDGERLDRDDSYRRMLALNRELEADPAVGRVVSIAILLAEAQRFDLSFLMTWKWIVDVMGAETTGAFLTGDRRQALYLLQMAESERDASRTEVVERLRGVSTERGFDVLLVGGIYALQGRLADLVSRSVLFSLLALIGLFCGVAAFAAGSLRVGLVAGLSSALVPLGVLGAFGLAGIPLDVIAAPAASVGLGLAADAALHLISAWRRGDEATSAARWRHACSEQWVGVSRSAGIVALGFLLFALSSFPPTRRFGFGVALAALLGAAVGLWVIPFVAQRLGRRDRSGAKSAAADRTNDRS